MQLAAAASFLTILQDELILIQTHTHSILQIILLNLYHRDAGLNQIQMFFPYRVKKDVLPLVRSLCQDVEYEVRSCMCRQLENIAKGIGVEHTKGVILPELVELARDEGSSVRLAAFDTIVNLLEMFDNDDYYCTPITIWIPNYCTPITIWIPNYCTPITIWIPNYCTPITIWIPNYCTPITIWIPNYCTPITIWIPNYCTPITIWIPNYCTPITIWIPNYCTPITIWIPNYCTPITIWIPNYCTPITIWIPNYCTPITIWIPNYCTPITIWIPNYCTPITIWIPNYCTPITIWIPNYCTPITIWIPNYCTPITIWIPNYCTPITIWIPNYCTPITIFSMESSVMASQAMILFAEPKNFLSELYPTFSSLCHDPEISVRRTTANGFHEVVKLLGSSVHLIQKELIALLQDDSLEVLDALMDNLQEILEFVTSKGEGAGSESKQVNVPDLIPALNAAEQKAATSLKWRIHEKLLQKYSCLPRVISSDQIYFRFLQRMFTIITTNNVLPVQRQSARTLCVFLRYNRKQEQRQEVINKLVDQLGQGRSYWNRLRFLDICEIVIELFSKSYFCKYFLVPALELVNDPVANVRFKLCNMLPKLKLAIKMPTDKHLLQQLEFCVRKLLCREKDKDVMAIVRKTVLELDKMDITEPYQKRHEKDLLDQKKEKEENLLLEMEQLEKQQTEGKSSSEKLGERKHDLLRSHHFSVASTSTAPSASVPVLIRSNTTGNGSNGNKDTRKINM
ncbi:UNVERIFIED_CONTAM: hypothetical protein FKN15_070230 [Acipenser sinensis]